MARGALVTRGYTLLGDYLAEVLADGPSLLLRFNETTGTLAADSSGHGLNGTYANTPTLGVAGALTGSSDKAVTLNGVNQYVSVLDNALVDPGDTPFTLEVWVYPSSFASTNTIIDKGSQAYNLQVLTSGLIRFQKNAPGGGTISTSTVAVQLNAWSHVVVTKNGSDVHIYINGVDVTGTVTNRTIAANAFELAIGAVSTNHASPFTGTLDEVALYPAALSATRVLAHHKAALGPAKFSTGRSFVVTAGYSRAAVIIRLAVKIFTGTISILSRLSASISIKAKDTGSI